MMRSFVRVLCRFTPMLIVALNSAYAGTELRIHASAIQKILETEVFKENGRYYLFGDASTPCMSAFLSDPVVSMGAGRLRIKTHFYGAIGREIGESCVGLSEDFDALMTGIPVFRQGALTIDSIEVTGLSGNPKFDEYVVTFLKQELPGMIEYKLKEEIQKLLIENRDKTPFRIDLLNIDIPKIQVLENQITLLVDLGLEIR